MTDLEMVEALRDQGYRVILPPDLRIAGPWTPTTNRRPGWERVWEGSTVTAVSVVEVNSRCCRHRQCCCENHDPTTWEWSASLIGNRVSNSTNGRSDSPECAKATADGTLMDLLKNARATRLKQIHRQTECVEPSEQLMLPSE
jgi:hypothetical protein